MKPVCIITVFAAISRVTFGQSSLIEPPDIPEDPFTDDGTDTDLDLASLIELPTMPEDVVIPSIIHDITDTGNKAGYIDGKYYGLKSINNIEPSQFSTLQRPVFFGDLTDDSASRTHSHRMDGSADGKDHECYRECKIGDKPKRCYYKFTVEWYHTMSKACFDCPFNFTHCNSKDCVPASGVNRAITVINRKLPGPKIEVCQYDTIVVDLRNSLQSSTTTMHWHGIHQVQTPYMDGAPFITQCPIQPESTFRYKFLATESGTHFYHSHIGFQRGDGTYGPLVIRRPKMMEHNRNLYKYDLSDHIITVSDWTDSPALGLFIRQYHSSGFVRPSTLLINGAGRFKAGNAKHNGTADLRPAKFNVKQGERYRFRVINAEFLSCPVELSVEGHNITVIAADGAEIEPISAAAVVSFSGERYDFVLKADRLVGNYWIVLRSVLGCETVPEARQVAILHYSGAKNAEPANEPLWIRPPGVILNAENTGKDPNKNTLTISEMRAVQENDDTLKSIPDQKIFIAFDLYPVNNTIFHRPPYTRNAVDPIYRMSSPQFNHISMKHPSSPLLVSRPSSDNFCNADTVKDKCINKFCRCTHVVPIKLNSVVELILIDKGTDVTINHPFHIHGYYLRVLSQVKLGNSTTEEEVRKLDRTGQLKRNFLNPPLKDTVPVPDGGYSVVRFKASNPGYWLFHCHFEYHAELGMSLAFKVGEHADMKPVPNKFQNCGDYGV